MNSKRSLVHHLFKFRAGSRLAHWHAPHELGSFQHLFHDEVCAALGHTHLKDVIKMSLPTELSLEAIQGVENFSVGQW